MARRIPIISLGTCDEELVMRLSNWDAATFYTLVGKGTAVTIR